MSSMKRTKHMQTSTRQEKRKGGPRMIKDKQKNADAPVRRAEGLRQFAKSLSISYDSAFRKATSGELKTIRFGKRILIPCDEIERIMREGL